MKTEKIPSPPPIQFLRTTAISPNKLNPRQGFSEQGDAELDESLKQFGFDPAISHLLLRPVKQDFRVEVDDPLAEMKGKEKPVRLEVMLPSGEWSLVSRHVDEDGAWDACVNEARFEIVFGHRRWRRSCALAIQWVPAVVQELSDAEVLERMMIENLQREDFTPFEEALGYERMLALRNESKKALWNIKTLAVRLGKSDAHLRQMLGLLKLRGGRGEKELSAGTLPVRHAIVIAKLPTQELRDEVVGLVLENPYGASPMHQRDLEMMLIDKYQRELRGAPFAISDAILVPMKCAEDGEREMGGACTDCPFNSKNDPQDNGRMAMCRNPACFKIKCEAHHDRWAKSVTNEEEKRTALPAAENGALWDFTGKHLQPSTPYFDLAEQPPGHELKPGEENPPTWAKLLKDQNVPVIVAIDRAGKVHELVNREAARAAAIAGGSEIFRPTEKKRRPSNEEEDQEALRKAKIEHDRAKEIAAAELQKIHETVRGLKKFPDAAWPLLVDPLIVSLEEIGEAKIVAGRHGRDVDAKIVPVEFLRKYFKKLPENQRFGFLVELCIAMMPISSEGLRAWAKALGTDLKEVRKAIQKRHQEEDAAAVETAEVTEGMKWSSRREKVEDFEWNAQNVCESPDRCSLALPKTKAIASLEVARSEKGWHYGIQLKLAQGGYVFPVTRTGVSYSSRKLVVASALAELRKDPAFGFDKEAAARLDAYIEMVKGVKNERSNATAQSS